MTPTGTDHLAHTQKLQQRVEGMFPELQHLSYDRFQEITATASEAAGEGPLLIDVREREEHETGTLPGGTILEEAKNLISQQPTDVKRPIICFCTIGLRSAAEARRLMNNGHTVYNYSVMTHLVQGGSLVKPDGQPWDETVHTYAQNYAGAFPAQYKAIWFNGVTALMRALPVVPALFVTLLRGPNKRP